MTVEIHQNNTYFAHGKLREVGQQPWWCPLSNQEIRPLFSLGQVTATGKAMIAVLLAAQEAQSLLDRHQFGDWGKLPPEEVQENIISVQQGLKVISAYSLKTGTTIFVVTEADRSTTTLLLSEEV